MKTKLHCHLLIALPFLAGTNILAADSPSILASVSHATYVAGGAAIPEDLGCDIRDGKTNKIARVYKADPLSVYVIYEGNLGGRKIPRSELPPQLQARYPYEAEKAVEFQSEQAATSARLADQQRVLVRESLHRRENALLGEIAALEKENVEAQKERHVLNQLTNGGRRGGGGRLVRLEQLTSKRFNTEKRIEALKSQVEQVRAQMDRVP